MKPNNEYKKMYAIAIYSFPFITNFVIDHGTSRKKAGGTELTTVRNLPKLDRKQFLVDLEPEARKEKMNSIIAKYQPRNAVTSKTAAKNIVSRCIQFCVHSFAKNIFEFLHGMAGEKSEVPKMLRTLDKYDILGLVFRPRPETWCNEEVVDPNTNLLATSFKTIDPAPTISTQKNNQCFI